MPVPDDKHLWIFAIICTQSIPEAMSSFTDPVSMSVLKLQSISAFTSTTSYTSISVAVEKHPVSTSVGLSLYFKFCSTLGTSTATLREWLFLLWSVPGMGDLLLFTVEHTAQSFISHPSLSSEAPEWHSKLCPAVIIYPCSGLMYKTLIPNIWHIFIYVSQNYCYSHISITVKNFYGFAQHYPK